MRRTRKADQHPENGFEAWGGYMNAKKAKLMDQFDSGASKESHLQPTSKIFSGVSVYVNGYTVPSSDEIKMAMMVNGGQYHQYYSAKTKFIIASNLCEAKLKKLKGHPKVVKPQWVADCLVQKKLLDFRPYLLYSNQSKTQPKIQFPQVSEFESPVRTPKFKELKLSFGESSQKLTSTPKVGKKAEPEKAEDSDISQTSSLNLSADLFDESSTSSITKSEPEEIQIDSESSVSTPSSECSLFGGDQPCAESTKIIRTPTPEGLEEEEEDLFDCTLVAEELDAAEREAEESKRKSELEQSEDLSELLKSNTTETPDLLVQELEEAKLTYSTNVTALVETPCEQDKPKEKPAESVPEKREANPKGPMKRAGETNFLAEFYSNSRLHHISTMGSTFKAYVTELRKSHSGEFPGRAKLLQWKSRGGIEQGWTGGKIIMHIDMDCFFVSVGMRTHPELKGQPVAVTHAKGNPPPGSSAGASRGAEFELYKKRMQSKTGVDSSSDNFGAALDKRLSWRADALERSSMSEIASCNYEARKAGLKNGMFLGQALKLCPGLKTIPYDFEGYKEVSYALYDMVASFTLDIEAVSCDEMFVDCSDLLRATNTHPLDFATFVRNEIKTITKCPASAGFGSNVLQARMATKRAKPDGQFYLRPDDVADFIKDIKISDLPGVGRNLTFKMQSLGLQTCLDLQKMSLPRLQATFGQKLGGSLYKHCRGDDDRTLDFEHVRKSVSAEVNYGIRFQTLEECAKFVQELALEVQTRLETIDRKGRCITLKLMVKAKEAPEETAKFMGHGVCDSFSKSSNLLAETSDANVISREVMQMLNQMGMDFKLYRGMGVQMTKLVEKKKGEGSLSRFLAKANQPFKPQPAAIAGSSKELDATVKPGPSKALSPPPQIDQAVLAELPEEIREEILREYGLAPAPTLPAVPIWPIDRPSTSTAAEMTFSQVDQSFLDALPEDLKLEVVADLKTNKTRQTSKQFVFPGITNSPSKLRSPPKKKRGRPKGSRNGSFKEPPKLKIQKSPLKFETVNSPEVEVIEESSASSEDSEDDDQVLNVKTGLTDILSLVKEWVQSSEEPLDFDIDMMLDFLKRLLLSRKLDKVEAVLRTIKLHAARRECSEWTSAYLSIEARIQPSIVESYGCKLHL